ncbi:MAG: phospholipase D family protein [Verrucomicrobiales bacterium]|nr:phospholipase D family protein [Verrucomicrobiales bacterium]
MYFSPAGGAEASIVSELQKAREQILLQAYAFTSAAIARALIDAKQRGVEVVAILDKSNESAKYSAAKFLANHDIPVYTDWRPTIAHSKILLIDGKTIITSSFNFTRAAELSNTENLLVIKKNPSLMVKYRKNFDQRLKESRKRGSF